MEVDLNKFLPKEFSLYRKVIGYYGNDSLPPCTPYYCFYLVQEVFDISKAQLDKLKVEGVEYNNRDINIQKDATWLMKAEGLFFDK